MSFGEDSDSGYAVLPHVQYQVTTREVVTRFGTMGTKSPGLGRGEHGDLLRVGPPGLKTRVRRPITEVV
jgi:hypothetical protein